MNPYFKFIILSFILLNSACATLSREECLQGSWFDLGLMDGRSGTTYTRLGNHQKACLEYGIRLDTKQYNAGRERGLEEYCQLDNAIEMGLHGHRYQSVCPPSIHSAFQRYNRAAYNVYQCKEALEKLDSKLHDKEDKLLDTKLSDEKRAKIRKKIHRLDRERQRLRDELYSSERRLDHLLERQQPYYRKYSPRFGL